MCFQKLQFQELLKTRVILILNFTRPLAITYTKIDLGSEREKHLNSPTILPSEQTIILSVHFAPLAWNRENILSSRGCKKENIKLKTSLEEALEQFKSRRDEAKNSARAEDSRIIFFYSSHDKSKGTRRRMEFRLRTSGEVPTTACIGSS